MSVLAPYPHRGACPGCHDAKRCNYCGVRYHDHCTNGRCLDCHRQFCTPGGATSDGHAFGPQGDTNHRIALTPLFTDEEQREIDNEMCAVCSLPYIEHDGRELHRFRPTGQRYGA